MVDLEAAVASKPDVDVLVWVAFASDGLVGFGVSLGKPFDR